MMENTVFLLSPLITENFDEKFKKKFLTRYRMGAEYARSDKKYHIFVQEKIRNGKIKKEDLAKSLYDDLLYGNQRRIRVYKICSYDKKMQNSDELLSRLQSYYPYVDTLDFNKILFQAADDQIEDLVGIDICWGLGTKIPKVQEINMIFSEQCTISEKKGKHNEYSYITVTIDFMQNLLFIKVKPKTGVEQEDKKPDRLMQKYFEKITRIFSIYYHEYINLHQNTLCNMNIELYKQIYHKIVKSRSGKLNKYAEQTANEIIRELGINNYAMKVAENNVFNIQDILQKMLEHVLISDSIYESKDGKKLQGVDGYVTYVKFSDGTNINARLKGNDAKEPIFSSETFMALRSSMENAQRISELKIYWFNKFSGLRVAYDAVDSQYLEISIFRHHKREEFEYAIAWYKECEQRTIEQNSELFSLEA